MNCRASPHPITRQLTRLRSVVVITALLSFALLPLAAQAAKVRPAYCAGRWYPGDQQSLRSNIENLLDRAAPPEITGRPLAVIAPHAGYRFSAPTAA